MKLKNSYILLIVIAISLLISIGSVCASENATSDSDIKLTNDQTDITLKNSADDSAITESNDEGTQEKINTTVNVDGQTEFEYDDDKNITVTVKDNNSENIEGISSNNLSVYEGFKALDFEYNNSVLTITSSLSVGNHTLFINYLGNANYTNSTTTIKLSILGDRTLTAPENVITDGETISIPITVYDGVKYIDLTNKTKFILNLTYTDSTGNITSNIISSDDFELENNTIKVSNLTTYGKLISASILMNYTDAANTQTISIKLNTTVEASDIKKHENETKNLTIAIKYGSEELNITKSDLKVLENGNEINFTYANSTITFSSLAIGEHNLTIIYAGNETYYTSNKTIIYKVYGNTTLEVPETVVSDGQTIIIVVKVTDGADYFEITDKSKFVLNITYTDSEGNITSSIISSDDFELENENGNCTITITNPITDRLISASILVNYTDAINTETVAVRLNTTVEASDIKKRENETKNLTITVKFGDENLTITQSDLRVLDNGNEIAFTYENSTITFSSLTVGKHNLTIIYKGNDTYYTSNTTITYKVSGDLIMNPDTNATIDDTNTVTITINLSDGVDPVDIDKDNLTVVLYWTNSTGNYTETITDITVLNQTISFIVDKELQSAYVTLTYKAENNLTANVTIKFNTEITADDNLTVGENQTIELPISVISSNGTEIVLTADNLKILNGNEELNITIVNGTVTINNKFTHGNYNLTIKFIGNTTYSDMEKNLLLLVYGFDMNTTSVKVNSTRKGKVIINNITDGLNNYTIENLVITVTYTDGNETKYINLLYEINGKTIEFELEHGNFTTATMIIKYQNSTASVTLSRIFNVRVEEINNQAEYQTGNFTYRLIDIDTEEVIANKTIKLTYSVTSQSITFQQTMESKTDENGIVIFSNAKIFVTYFNLGLPIGNNTVTLAGDSLSIVNSSRTVVITKATIKITITPYKEYYGSTKQVVITVVNAKTGDPVKYTTIHLYMKDSSAKDYYFSTDENGTSKINVAGLVGGTYPITVNNNDTTNMYSAKATGNIVIVKIPVKISAKASTVYYNTGTTSTIKITKNGKAVSGVYVLVRLYKTSKKYEDYLFKTDKKGKITFSASLTVGKHKMIVKIADNRYQASNVGKYIKVKKATAKLTAPKVTTYYKSGKYFTIKLTNTKKKKVIYDAKVNIKIFISKTRYYNYNGKTGANGKLKLLINLKPGTYNVVLSGASSKNYKAKQITSRIIVKKTPTKLIPKKVSAKKGKTNYFKVTAKNTKTKKVIAGLKLKVKVYTGKKYKTYTVKTNSKGLAKLNTKSLATGTHKVVVSSGNKYCVGKSAKSAIVIKK